MMNIELIIINIGGDFVEDLYLKLKQNMKEYSRSSNIMKEKYGLDEEIKYYLIIVAPY